MAWERALGEALGRTETFVPLLSPSYFASANCGKEWSAFSKRLPESHQRLGQPGLVQPVLLVPQEDLHPMPAVVAALQYTHEDYPEVYKDRGLLYLLDVRGEDDNYNKFVHVLADKLVRAARSHRLAPAAVTPSFTNLSSAFHDARTSAQVVDQDAPPGRRLFAQFLYVAARKQELAGHRQQCSGYGVEGGLDWQPYLPVSQDEVGWIANSVALRERYRYEPVQFDEMIVSRIEEAVRERKVVVVIVDVWTLRLDRYRMLMSELDRYNLFSCIVMAPVNIADEETRRDEPELRSLLEETFFNRHMTADPDTLAMWVSSAQELESRLADMLGKAKMRIIRRYEVTRRAGGPGTSSRPPLIVGTSPRDGS